MGRYNSSVVIESKMLERWNALRTAEDAEAIAERAKVTKQTVYNAFNDGRCQQYLLDIMTAYYDDKYEAFQQRLSDYYD